MGGTVSAFPPALSRPLGAQLQPTSERTLEKAIDWVCSWRAGGGSRVEDAVGIALAVGDATEVVLLADQCPTRGIPMALGKHQAQQQRPINTVAFGGDLASRRFLIQISAATGGWHRDFEMHLSGCEMARMTTLETKQQAMIQARSGLLYGAADFSSLGMRCSCVDFALSSDSDFFLRQFLSKEELSMLEARLDDIHKVCAENLDQHTAMDRRNAAAKAQFEASKDLKAAQRLDLYQAHIKAFEEKKVQFLRDKRGEFDRTYTEPATVRNSGRLIRACWEFYSVLFSAQPTMPQAESESYTEILKRNMQLLTSQVESKSVSNHDISTCFVCRTALLNSKALILSRRNNTEQLLVPTIVSPIKFKGMRSDDFTEKFQEALVSSLCTVASVRRKTIKEIEFSKEFKSPLPDAGVTRTDVLIGPIVQNIPSMYAQKELGMLPSLEVPVSIYVDKNVAQECLKRVTEAIEWGRLKSLMDNHGFDVKIDFETRPIMFQTTKFQNISVSRCQAELLQNYSSSWEAFMKRYETEWIIPKANWTALQERYQAAAERENFRRLVKKRESSLSEYDEAVKQVHCKNMMKLKRLETRLRKSALKERAKLIMEMKETYELEKREADERYCSAYKQAIKHNAKVKSEFQRLKAESKMIAEQKALLLKVSNPSRKEDRQKGLRTRSHECLQMAVDLVKQYNTQATEFNRLEASEALQNFERHCRQRQAENEESIVIELEAWEEKKRDAENKNAAILEEYKLECDRTDKHNFEISQRYQERLESIRKFNQTRMEETTAKWQRDASIIERRNQALIERFKGRWAAAVRRIERKNEIAIKQASLRYHTAFDAMIRHNTKVQVHYEQGQQAATEMLRCRRFLDVLLNHCSTDDSEWEQSASAAVILHSAAAAKASLRFSWWAEAGWTEKEAATRFILGEMHSRNSQKDVACNDNAGGVQHRLQYARDQMIIDRAVPSPPTSACTSMNTVGHGHRRRLRPASSRPGTGSGSCQPRPHQLSVTTVEESLCREGYWSMFEPYTPHRPHSARHSTLSVGVGLFQGTVEAQRVHNTPRPPQGPRIHSAQLKTKIHERLAAFGGGQPRLALWGVPASASAIPPLLGHIAISARLEEADRLRASQAEAAAALTSPAKTQQRCTPATVPVKKERQFVSAAVVAEALIAAYGPCPVQHQLPDGAALADGDSCIMPCPLLGSDS
eukprot:CAMPEP_0172152344 /NCGR_PEP_ID=MMETSP1050-20130122/787_1 /TAXON_ID=233186 /ORGANISM="Cryptomonas curvata, Strain CCAP979/52" /LENGTH=1195 /DNA_ID=CAMNT_0012820659 /DNA_START=44 /DNA_END=3632 /DNA_ORIENTATION=-